MKYISRRFTWCFLALTITVFSTMAEVHAGEAVLQEKDLKQIVQRAEKAGLSSRQVQNFIQRAREKGLENEQIIVLIKPAVKLAEQKLPGDMILQKAFEGLAKGVAPQRIKPVILDLKKRIQKAENVIDPWMKNKEDEKEKQFITENGVKRPVRYIMIEAAAQALSGSVSTDRLKNFLKYLDEHIQKKQYQPDKIAAALHVMPDLITTRKYPKLSKKLLANAINAGFSESDIHQLPQAMKMAQKNSRLPAKAVASGFTRQVENGLSATRIIQNLQIGNVEGGKIPPQLQKQPKGPDQNPAADKKKKDG